MKEERDKPTLTPVETKPASAEDMLCKEYTQAQANHEERMRQARRHQTEMKTAARNRMALVLEVLLRNYRYNNRM